jgi:hypothetical protein
MKWFTRRGLHVDRTACAWLILSRIDSEAEFVFVSPEDDVSLFEGHSFDMRGATFSHSDGKCTFEVLLERYRLEADLALLRLGKIVREADVPARGRRLRESAGLDAIMRGFQLGVADDQEKIRLTGPVYDALYVYCRESLPAKQRSQATPRPRLTYRQRVIRHLEETDQSSPAT